MVALGAFLAGGFDDFLGRRAGILDESALEAEFARLPHQQTRRGRRHRSDLHDVRLHGDHLGEQRAKILQGALDTTRCEHVEAVFHVVDVADSVEYQPNSSFGSMMMTDFAPTLSATH